jgi:hypothetical protein
VGSLLTLSVELFKYKLDLVGVQEVRRAAPNLRENTHFSTERGMRIMNYVQFFFS